MEKTNDQAPAYGNPKYEFTLGWHDEKAKDYLVVLDYKKKSEVMNARAKGTTIYELIDIYGGVDNVSEAFSKKNDEANYADTTLVPEFANDESYSALMKAIKATQTQLADLQKKQESEKASKEPVITKDEVK